MVKALSGLETELHKTPILLYVCPRFVKVTIKVSTRVLQKLIHLVLALHLFILLTNVPPLLLWPSV